MGPTLFARIARVACGPGSMAQGQQAHEFVSQSLLDGCDTLLERLLE
ncbi:acetylornithine deacetylase [Pseudomonas borbori]|uniref:Acetylornithine deacetylase n=1 Tax=Pseudomonas borbori TaxID=289003 RepID=A0A1I5M9M9_9PSED|nr:acetylornithine deacetylase [Pseudomonas borbori]